MDKLKNASSRKRGAIHEQHQPRQNYVRRESRILRIVFDEGVGSSVTLAVLQRSHSARNPEHFASSSVVCIAPQILGPPPLCPPQAFSETQGSGGLIPPRSGIKPPLQSKQISWILLYPFSCAHKLRGMAAPDRPILATVWLTIIRWHPLPPSFCVQSAEVPESTGHRLKTRTTNTEKYRTRVRKELKRSRLVWVCVQRRKVLKHRRLRAFVRKDTAECCTDGYGEAGAGESRRMIAQDCELFKYIIKWISFERANVISNQ